MSPDSTDSTASARSHFPAAVPILLGIAVHLVANGYQFGLSNHSVYLIDALRKADPTLLANDWFYTQTLQYHSVFGWLTATLLKLGVLEAGFIAIFGLMLLVFHASWRGIVRQIGGTDQAYLLSVVLYFISAGGIGLGTYQFFQDSAVLASNVANVAMFAGVAGFVSGRWIVAGVGFGVAGLFHLNHAAAGLAIWGMWAIASLPRWWRLGFRDKDFGCFAIGSACLAAGCLANIIPAVEAKLARSGSVPLDEFIDLYARLRHPHHYDPSSWPFAQWLAFCFWIPLGLVGGWTLNRRRSEKKPQHVEGEAPAEPSRELSSSDRSDSDGHCPAGASPFTRAGVVLISFMLLQLVALTFAGIFYVSETLVQLSLFRFSIVPHLLLVVLSAGVLTRFRFVAWAVPACLVIAVVVTSLSPMAEVARQRIGPMAAMIVLAVTPAAIEWLQRRPWRGAVAVTGVAVGLAVGWTRLSGLTRPLVYPDSDYRALCSWVASDGNTPRDAVFLVPPMEEDFRWFARRAIVVNWKSVPQLAGELPEWRDRMAAALGWPNLDPLPRGSYVAAQRAMSERCDRVDGKSLFAAARRYHADFVVATHDLGLEFERHRVGPVFGRYLLYHVSR